MKFLSLFAGIGGFDLGLERAGMECVGQVENDPFCLKVLEKHWPHVKRIADIRDVKGDEFGPVDLICGGFPCQPWSGAGKRLGTQDDRDLWPEMLRVIEIVRPRWVVGENVRGFVSMEMGVDRSISNLEGLGYAVQAFVIPACAVDAPHRRDRVWIVAHTKDIGHERPRHTRRGRLGFKDGSGPLADPNSKRELQQGGLKRQQRQRAGDGGEDVSDDPKHGRRSRRPRRLDPSGAGEREQAFQDVPDTNNGSRSVRRDGELPATAQIERRGTDNGRGTPEHEPGQRWLPEPAICRVAHGVPRRVDRLRALGNAVVPQIVEIIGNAILEAEKENNPQSIPKNGSR